MVVIGSIVTAVYHAAIAVEQELDEPPTIVVPSEIHHVSVLYVVDSRDVVCIVRTSGVKVTCHKEWTEILELIYEGYQMIEKICRMTARRLIGR